MVTVVRVTVVRVTVVKSERFPYPSYRIVIVTVLWVYFLLQCVKLEGRHFLVDVDNHCRHFI